MAVEYDFEGFDELKRAVERNPRKVIDETGKFLARGIAAYNRGIIRSPWRVGGGGGGAPSKTGNLRDKHRREVRQWEASITPIAPYAAFVHEGTRHMRARPWLDYVKDNTRGEIEKLEKDLMDNIIADLAK